MLTLPALPWSSIVSVGPTRSSCNVRVANPSVAHAVGAARRHTQERAIFANSNIAQSDVAVVHGRILRLKHLPKSLRVYPAIILGTRAQKGTHAETLFFRGLVGRGLASC